jgi:serine phosphatase RsbU (regulator of sigma subunit)
MRQFEGGANVAEELFRSARRASMMAGAPAGPSVSGLAAARRVRGWRPSRAALWTLLAGLAITAALALTSLVLYDRNEDRLLHARGRELGLLLSSAISNVQTPLASAAALADATSGSPGKFGELLGAEVGVGKQFISASLWRVGASRPTAVLGIAPAITSDTPYEHRFFARAAASGVLSVTKILTPAHPRIGYAYRVPGSKQGLFVYAEDLLPADRRSRLQSNSAFASLNYALYLGRGARSETLLVTDLRQLPPRGRSATVVVPFANSQLTLIVTPVGSLSGSFFHDLPLLIAVIGALVALLAALLTDRLANRRRRAEELALLLEEIAQENRALYTEQRSIAQQLQAALLGDSVPSFEGLEVSARYVPGIAGIDVGGDWYDLVARDDGRVMLVVGDVSGRGLHAATTMAFLRNSIVAYATDNDGPATVLRKLSRLVSSKPHDYFATVLCALIDVEAHEMTIVSAGHLPPLLIEKGRTRFVELPVGPPIGATSDAEYVETTIAPTAKATFLAFTDGLVERRGETLDAGLERLRSVAGRRGVALEKLLERIVSGLGHDDVHDDTAILAVRWQN